MLCIALNCLALLCCAMLCFASLCILRSILLCIALLCIALLRFALLYFSLRSEKYKTFWRFPFRVKRGSEVAVDFLFEAVRKFSKNFGKLMVFQDEGDVGGAFALLLLCCCFGVTPIGAL